MKAIHADPREIRKIFTDKYIIPDFQRPYSWDRDQCDQLWEDFIDFYENQTSKDDKYFLGNIVINPAGEALSVIDGQQRLTTLLLLIKAFHSKAGTAVVLEECLRIKDPLTSQLTDELRLDSHVIDDDKKHLYDIVFNNGDNTPDCPLKANYTDFCDKIDEWWKLHNYSTDSLNRLILCLLDQIVLLPIHCGSEDDALTIFETINNRGMSLSDADIFKAKLHHAAGDKKDEFVKDWNALEDDHEWLFRILMHILRAKEGDSGKEIGLRPYFTNSAKNRFSDWESVMNSLKMIDNINNDWTPTPRINILWYILNTYPNYYWNFPLYVFLNKYGKFDGETYNLPKVHNEEFTQLLEYTVKYFFIKGVVYNTVNYIKDAVFKTCVAIEAEKDYLEEYKKITAVEIDTFNQRIKNRQYGRYLKGLVLLSAYLNPKQNLRKFESFLCSNYHIEHILPKKWNNYDGWSETTWDEDLNSLGNLIPLERNFNIYAKNEFFNRKKECYTESKVQDALDLTALDEWTPQALHHMQEEKEKRLNKFFVQKQ